MHLTVNGILNDVTKDAENEIIKLMKAFCSAKRYALKQLATGKVKIKEKGQLEKDISLLYGLNIRQSKDAVEASRRIIKSQKKLLAENYINCKSKMKDIKIKIHNGELEDVELEKIKRELKLRIYKQELYKNHIKDGTIPFIIFGGKENYNKMKKGEISVKEWNDLRNNSIFSRGDKTKKDNPNLRIIIKDESTFLEISTLNRYENNMAKKIQVPLYLPQKKSKTGKINGINYKQKVLDFLKTGEAYFVELIKKEGKIYCHITIDENKLASYERIYDSSNGIIGVDTNPDGFALTKIDIDGNYKWDMYFRDQALLYASSNKRDNIAGELAKKVVDIAKKEACAIALEDLKFRNNKNVNKNVTRIYNEFSYRSLLNKLERRSMREGVQSIKVQPNYTSIIGQHKYTHKYKISVHNGAALVVARRALGYKENVPLILKYKLLSDDEKFEFNKLGLWEQWYIIDKKIKENCIETNMWGPESII